MKTCLKCKAEKADELFSKDKENKDGLKRYCKDCCRKMDRAYVSANPQKHRDNVVRWLKANPEYQIIKWREYRTKNRHKVRARQQVRYHVAVGNLVKGNCVVCGSSRVEGHHKDYSKPLDVVWLCHLHHEQVDHGYLVL